MLFYTGIKRTAADVARSYALDIDQHDRPLRMLSHLVDEGLALLCSNQDLRGFGALLHEAWLAKKALSDSVSNPYVDQLYEAALSAGALGGKLLGAGGGGFLLLFVPLDRQACVRRQLCRLLHVPFQFEFSGSHVVLVDHEVDYAADDRARANVTQDGSRTHSGDGDGL
jgi:D-glycero-alpha-D-manno-heptose-7-phosphate kinase